MKKILFGLCLAVVVLLGAVTVAQAVVPPGMVMVTYVDPLHSATPIDQIPIFSGAKADQLQPPASTQLDAPVYEPLQEARHDLRL